MSFSDFRTTTAALGVILSGAAFLRFWRLDENEYGRQYYAAGVRSMLQSWHNFWFNSFDPAGFVSLDKPPVAIWVQVASAKLLGFGPLAVLLPQAVEGLAAALLIFVILRRRVGPPTALIAAGVLAITPAAVAVDRSNNTESCLVVALLCAAWLAIRACETARAHLLALAMGALGVGFNIKMGAAWALAPVLALTYLCEARDVSLGRRISHAAVAGTVLLATSLIWVALYDLTPARERPYVGSTKTNSMVELTLYHNGVARFVAPSAVGKEAGSGLHRSDPGLSAPGSDGWWDQTPAGMTRLLTPLHAGQVAWWLPFAMIGILIGFRGGGTARRATAVFTGWLATYWLLFSFAGGPFHTYYLAVLGPPLAALSAIGIGGAVRFHKAGEPRPILPALLIVAVLWQAHIVSGQAGTDIAPWLLWMGVAALGVTATAAALLALRPEPSRTLVLWSAGCTGLTLMPTLCALSVVLVRPNVAAPVATLRAFQDPPSRAQRAPQRLLAGREKLIAFVRAQHTGERFVLAVPNAGVAAPLIVLSGAPIISFGGYAGTDPILSPDGFERMAREGELRFVMLGGFRFSQRADLIQEASTRWVRENGQIVDPSLWRSISFEAANDKSLSLPSGATPTELFDLSLQRPFEAPPTLRRKGAPFR